MRHYLRLRRWTRSRSASCRWWGVVPATVGAFGAVLSTVTDALVTLEVNAVPDRSSTSEAVLTASAIVPFPATPVMSHRVVLGTAGDACSCVSDCTGFRNYQIGRIIEVLHVAAEMHQEADRAAVGWTGRDGGDGLGGRRQLHVGPNVEIERQSVRKRQVGVIRRIIAYPTSLIAQQVLLHRKDDGKEVTRVVLDLNVEIRIRGKGLGRGERDFLVAFSNMGAGLGR